MAPAPAPVPARPPTGALPPVLPGPAVPGSRVTASPPVFVLNSLDASVSVIDPRTWTELRRIPVGKEPHHLYLTPDEKSVLVANAAGNSITMIDPVTGDVQRTINDIVDPYHLRFSPDMKWFVTAANRLNHIDIYRWEPQNLARPLRLAKRIEAAKTPSHIWIDSKSTVAYVTLQDSNELIAIDLVTQTPRWEITVGPMPADVYVTPDDRLLFVGLTGDKFVEVYDVSGREPRLVKRIETGAGAHAFRARGDRRHLFVSNRVANTVSMIDTQSLTEVFEIPVPGGPDCMDLMSDGRTLLITARWARRLTVVDTETRQITRQINVGRSPHGVWTLDHAARE
jgi:YVTN family beta-propeller protein